MKYVFKMQEGLTAVRASKFSHTPPLFLDILSCILSTRYGHFLGALVIGMTDPILLYVHGRIPYLPQILSLSSELYHVEADFPGRSSTD